MESVKLLVLSDAHFFDPNFYRYRINEGRITANPSRLSTDLALGDSKINPFQSLILLARNKEIEADALVFCGDLTTCADPTAMNLGWLQLHRLCTELGIDEPIIATGNHDVDSRFLISDTSPSQMLRFLDPPYPTRHSTQSTCFWANGYCILDKEDARFVVINTCALHGYATQSERQSDHGMVPETVFRLLEEDLNSREEKRLNFLICHHHPVEMNLPPEDRSVIGNGDALIDLLEQCGSHRWVIFHGHRHLPGIRYAGNSQHGPIVFSAGSMAANLHLNIQGRTANQFYEVGVKNEEGLTLGRFKTRTWDQDRGLWMLGQDTNALPSIGGFGYRHSGGDVKDVAERVPEHQNGPITWKAIEDEIPLMAHVTLDDRNLILEELRSSYHVEWESDNGRTDVPPGGLRLGREI